MEKVLARGGSVLHQVKTEKFGQTKVAHHVISDINQLPSAAELAKGDPVKEADVYADIQRRQELLDKELALLAGK